MEDIGEGGEKRVDTSPQPGLSRPEGRRGSTTDQSGKSNPVATETCIRSWVEGSGGGVIIWQTMGYVVA